MKGKLILFLVIGLLGSTVYVGASSLMPDDETPVINQTTTNQTNWERWHETRNSGHMFRDSYISQEEHELIMEKRIELSNSLFSNYEEMTATELIELDASYHEAMRLFMENEIEETLGSYYGSESYVNRHTFDDETHALIIKTRMKLMNEYLSNYAELTSDEKRIAETNYFDAMHEFMYSLMHDSGYSNEYGYGNCHGSRYREFNGENDYNQQNYNTNTRTHRRGSGMMGW